MDVKSSIDTARATRLPVAGKVAGQSLRRRRPCMPWLLLLLILAVPVHAQQQKVAPSSDPLVRMNESVEALSSVRSRRAVRDS